MTTILAATALPFALASLAATRLRCPLTVLIGWAESGTPETRARAELAPPPAHMRPAKVCRCWWRIDPETGECGGCGK